MADVSILDPAVHTAPKAYTVKGSQEVIIKSVTGSFDGTSAGGSWIPAVQIVDPSGFVTGTYPLDTTLTAGALADVSWFPGRVKRAASSGPSPNPLGTLWAWYDFADTTTITLDGSFRIAKILDKTGGGHDATQPTAGNRPSETTVNALNAGNFNNARPDYLQSQAWPLNLNQPYTFAAVWTLPSGVGGAVQPGPYGGTATPAPAILFYDSSGVRLAAEQGVGTILVAQTPPVTQQQATVLYNGGSSYLRLNGSQTNGTMDVDTLTNIALGSAHVPSVPGVNNFHFGAVCEVLVYQGQLSSAQLSAVESYLRTKWATP